VSRGAGALRVAVVGATSLIGEAVILELRARAFPIAELHALDDERHVGRAARDAAGEGEGADLKT
jgi:aspartate-semialdehyde dehydrogenase